PTRFTVPSSTASRWSAGATSAGRSSTTCGACAARRPRSRSCGSASRPDRARDCSLFRNHRRQSKLAPVMGGDHGGRQPGRDDDGYPSYLPRSRGSEGFQEHAWETETSSWDRPSEPATAPGGAYLYGPGAGYGAAEPYDARATASAGAYDPRTTGTMGAYDTGAGQSGYDAGARRYGGWYGDDDPDDAPVRAAAGIEGRRNGRRRSSAAGDGARRGLPLWQELPLLLVIAFCVAILVRTFVLQAFYIPSGSMEDTLLAGDRVLVNKLVYHFREPARGEVVVFRAESWSPQPNLDDDVGALARIGRALGDLVGISRPGEKDYIKRIIGLP